MEEQQLISELKNQQEKAIRFFVDLHQQAVFRIILKFVFDAQDAEDLTQETFMDALTHIQQFDESSTLKTWLYRIAVNRSLMFLRAKKRKKRFAYLRSIFDTQAEDDEPIAIIDTSANSEEELIKNQLHNKLKQALGKLPESQQTAFSLVYLSEMSYAETAHILETSQKAVEALLARAKSTLRKEMKDYRYENES